MSGTEILVVLSGLFVGYWVVSKLILPAPDAERPPHRQPDGGPEREASAGTPAWHEVLNVSPDATADEIRRSYKTMMSQYHPDKVATLGDELRALAESKTKQIASAYRNAMRLRGMNP